MFRSPNAADRPKSPSSAFRSSYELKSEYIVIGLQLSFQVDLAFACFTNLTELDLGRNRLQSLGNLPEGLVTLSCAANELSGMSRPELCIDE